MIYFAHVLCLYTRMRRQYALYRVYQRSREASTQPQQSQIGRTLHKDTPASGAQILGKL